MEPYYEQRYEMPSVSEVFYGPREPTFIMNTDPYGYQRQTHMMPPVAPVLPRRDLVDPALLPRRDLVDPALLHRRDLVDPAYTTRALVAPSSTQTHVLPAGTPVKTHPKGLVLSVPMCCDKCVEKVRKALEDLEGARDVVLDQYQQLVTISGDVDPEKALRRVRRVKKRSKFWRMSTQPLAYSGSPATGQVMSSKAIANSYRAPGYHTSAYRAPGYHTSAYRAPVSAYSGYVNPARPYSSPYIDSSYRSGYFEPRGLAHQARFQDDLAIRSRFDRGTPFVQMADDMYY